MGYYAINGDQGWAVFYHTDIHDTIPDGAIPVSDDDFHRAMSEYDAGQREYIVVQNGQLVFNPLPTLSPEEVLAEAKQAKKFELIQARDQAIHAGFTSSVTGHTYGYAPDDQMNLLKQTVRLMNDPSITSVAWYTLDAKIVIHTRDEFLSLQPDAEAHERAQHEKEWAKSALVDKCTTVDEVNSIVWDDTTPPAVPVGFTVSTSTGAATLSWTANTEIDLAGYNIYQNGTKINTQLVTNNYYDVTGLTSGSSYSFSVSAVDIDGNESAQCSPVSVTVN